MPYDVVFKPGRILTGIMLKSRCLSVFLYSAFTRGHVKLVALGHRCFVLRKMASKQGAVNDFTLVSYNDTTFGSVSHVDRTSLGLTKFV